MVSSNSSEPKNGCLEFFSQLTSTWFHPKFPFWHLFQNDWIGPKFWRNSPITNRQVIWFVRVWGSVKITCFQSIPTKTYHIQSGQISATSHDLTPNGGLVWFSKGSPFISKKPRLVKYCILARYSINYKPSFSSSICVIFPRFFVGTKMHLATLQGCPPLHLFYLYHGLLLQNWEVIFMGGKWVHLLVPRSKDFFISYPRWDQLRKPIASMYGIFTHIHLP